MFDLVNGERALLSGQNRDGGWGYKTSLPSCAEPTFLALLALHAVGSSGNEMERGLSWVANNQRADGGWAPQPGVTQSTWVTAMAVLVLSRFQQLRVSDPAIHWLLSGQGEESRLMARIRRRMLGNSRDYRDDVVGWPWFPGNSAWVVPTAISILALRSLPASSVRNQRIALGEEFLLSRRCSDGGWNHGGSRALGYEADAYPETTGIALTALYRRPPPELAPSLERAAGMLHLCATAEGVAWLRLGLLTNRHAVPDVPFPRPHTTHELCLLMLAEAASRGRNVLMETT